MVKELGNHLIVTLIPDVAVIANSTYHEDIIYHSTYKELQLTLNNHLHEDRKQLVLQIQLSRYEIPKRK